jgi:hypothetical protein
VKRLESGVSQLIAGYNHWRYGRQLDLVLAQLPGLRLVATAEEDAAQQQQQVSLLSLQHKIMLVLHQVKLMISRLTSATSSSGLVQQDSAEVVDIMRDFGSAFSSLVESLLADMVGKCVASLTMKLPEQRLRLPPRSSCDDHTDSSSSSKSGSCHRLHDSLVLVCRLGLEGQHICRLFSREGGVAALMDLLASANSGGGGTWQHKEAILRALSTVCCVLESVKEFEKRDGLRLIAGALRTSGDKDAEASRREAAGVLAQVTSPWLEAGPGLERAGLDEHAYDIVSSLTELCRATASSETFLLATAALANLTHLSPLVITAVAQLESLPPILAHLSRRVCPSIYILDQVATLLANLAACNHSRDALLQQADTVVPALLLLLAADPEKTAAGRSRSLRAGGGKLQQQEILVKTNSETAALLAATQRVQQKAAIAIGRLTAAGSSDFCLSLLSGGGLERLVELAVCRDARIDSDFTLVAVLTAVRKLSQVVDICSELLRLGAAQILDASILQSIHTFAPMQESFV